MNIRFFKKTNSPFSLGKSRFDCFNVSFFFLVVWIAGVVVPLYPFLLGIDGFSQVWGYSYSDKISSIGKAFVLYSAALVCVLVGCFLGERSHSLASVKAAYVISFKSFTVRSILLTFVALSAFFTILFLLGINGVLQGASDRTRAFAGLNGLFLLLNLMLSVSLAWYIRITREGKKTVLERFCFWIYFLIVLFICSLQGQKSTIFVILLSLVVVRHYRVGQISFLKAALIGLIMFVGLMIYHLFKQQYLATGDFSFVNGKDGVFLSFVKFLAVQYTGNLMQLQTMTVLVDAMPQGLDWQNGKTLLMVALILLPSVFFPNKPLTAAGIFTGAFWPDMWIKQGTTMPPGVFGEFYMNFGVPGVLLGGLFIGLIWGRLYGSVVYSPKSDRALGIYALTIASMLHLFRGELASVALLIASILVPFLLLSSDRKDPNSNPI